MPESRRAHTPLPTGTVTFLFTDVEGSTRLWEHAQAAMQDALALHDRLIRTAIESNDGHVIKSTGDGLHGAFATAADGLAAAIAAQRALEGHAWGRAVIRSRMALHTGTAEQRDGDYFGATLNRAARLMSAGHGGQILLSLATMELVRDHLPADIALRDLGERRLKDLIRPERIFEVVGPDLPSGFPALRTLDARPNNLPAQMTSLVGRERDIDAVRRKLAGPQVRLLTLTGVGGTGKTRLALQVAADVLDEFEHGVFLVELAAIHDAAFVVPSIAQALGLREAKTTSFNELLDRYLHDKQVLLVLDNFEQVVEAAPQVSSLLARAPRSKMLITSRERLHLAAEHVYPVEALSVPDPGQKTSLAHLAQYEAVRLFIDRALMIKPDFAVTNATAPAVAEICCQLDGLPLAIELAAARVQVLPPEHILARLKDRLRFLKGGDGDRPARQQTLRSTIDWSHDLLTDAERILFRRIAAFRGGCTLEAVEYVCDAKREFDVMEVVEALVAKSLLKSVVDDDELRVVMLETIRGYAAECLQHAGESDQINLRHQDFFLGLARRAQPLLFGPQQATWLQRLDNEIDNLRLALSEMIERREPEHALELCGRLGRLWRTRGYLSEGRDWCARALSRPASERSTAGRAAALSTVAMLANSQGDQAEAERCFQESLALFRTLEDQAGVAKSLNGLGNVALANQDPMAAQRFYQENLAIQRQLGDAVEIAGALNNLGMLSLYLGELAAANDQLAEALTMARALGDRNGVAGSLNNLGVIALERGDLALAQARFEECLAISKELNDQFGIAKGLAALGNVAMELGNLDVAQAYKAEGLTLDRAQANRPGIADALLSLGGIAYERGDHATSRTMLEESLSIWRALSVEWGVCHALSGLASLIAIECDAERAARIWGHVEAQTESGVAFGRPQHAQRISRARASASDDAAFARAWQEGRSMNSEQAIALAQQRS